MPDHKRRSERRARRRGSRISIGPAVLRGAAADLVATGLLCGVIFGGVSLTIVACGVGTALAERARGRVLAAGANDPAGLFAAPRTTTALPRT